MASFLALDWDHNRLHLLAATASRGQVRIEKVLVWDEKEDLTLANAEAAGVRLRERLNDAKLSSAPVLACVGRERVVLKEIQYPNVAPAQEPGLVRFQATKELTEALDSVVIDYAPLAQRGPAGESRALLLVARKHQVNAYKTFCRAAGLKLIGLTPRPFGVAACLKPAAAADPAVAAPAADAVVAILTVAEHWAEFVLVRSANVLFARSVPLAGNLLGEVRRNLTLYAGQRQVNPARDTVRALYVAGNGEHTLLRERLQETLAIPVHPMDPFAGRDDLGFSGDRAAFAAATGLVHAWAERQALPVNFAAPKEPKPEVHPGKRRLFFAGAAGVLAFVALIFAGMMMVNAREGDFETSQQELVAADSRLKRLQPEAKHIAAVADWHKTAVPVIDEIYDLTARFPYRPGLRVTQLNFGPLTHPNPKEPFTVRMTLTGVVPKDDAQMVHHLMDAINQDRYCRAAIDSLRPASLNSSDQSKSSQEFTLRVDIAPRPPAEYDIRLHPPERVDPGKDPGKGRGKGRGKGEGMEAFFGGGVP